MTGRTHDLAAVTALVAVAAIDKPGALSLSTLLFALLANQIGGIAPDIDQPTAPLWRNLPIGKFVGKGVDSLFGGHRFLTHSVLGLALFGFLAATFLKFISSLAPHAALHIIWWSFMIGMISHLIMDTFTKEGVPWLLPIPLRFGVPPLRKFRITTGKAIEKYVVFPGLLLILLLIGSHNYQVLQMIVQH
jgi:inner membrane protein